MFLSDSYNYTKEFNGYKSINNPGEKYGFQLCKNDGKKYFHDVMSCNCDPQERDIAMVIFGFAENKEQHYVTKKTGEKISNALKFFY